MNHKNAFFNKRAELTTQQIVLIIVLLASFIILLIFLFKVNFQEASEKEICQSSVQLVGKKTFFGGIDCKVHYLCISGGDNCKEFTYKNTAEINLKDKDEAKKKIMKVLADEMVDCWWMFGEGKIDYVDWTLTDSLSCAVCTQFAFDEKLKDSKINISSQDFSNFLKNTKRNEKQTYSDYFGDNSLLPSSFDFSKKYSIHTGRFEAGKVPFLSAAKDYSLVPSIFERNDFNTLKCSSFVTTP